LDGINEIFRLMRRHGVTDVAPEERGGHAFRQRLRNEGNSRGTHINVIDLKSMQTNKPQRIVSFLGEMQSLRVFISTDCEEQLKNAFLEQFEDFPQLDHEDALDAAAYTCDPAIAEAYAPMFNTYAQGRTWRTQRREPITRHSGW
jgi:hypothetical protein